jgi:putative membrane protein
MVWSVIRLFGFRLSRAGQDLRSTFGLLTRVATTIPIRRIQTMSVREGPLHRLIGRVSVRVETAGGGTAGGGDASAEREWLAPIIRPTQLPSLLREVEPDLNFDELIWESPHPRAFRRALKPRVFQAILLSALMAWPLHWWALAVALATLAIAVVAARQYVQHLAWTTTDALVGFKSGWLWRTTTIARTRKIQTVVQVETPFDRRSSMGQVHIDTAGASAYSHRIRIPYLSRESAMGLYQRLAAEAANTAFRW